MELTAAFLWICFPVTPLVAASANSNMLTGKKIMTLNLLTELIVT